MCAAVETNKPSSAAADADSAAQPAKKQRIEEEAPGISLFGGALADKGRLPQAVVLDAAPPVVRSNDPHEVPSAPSDLSSLQWQYLYPPGLSMCLASKMWQTCRRRGEDGTQWPTPAG